MTPSVPTIEAAPAVITAPAGVSTVDKQTDAKRKPADPKIPKDVGVIRVEKFRLNPTPVQANLLLQCCGTARATYNTLLFYTKLGV